VPAAPRAEPNSPEAAEPELRLLFLPLLELLPDLPEPNFDDDLSLDDKLVSSSEASFLSAAIDVEDENVVPVIPPALELGVSPGRLKLGKPNNGLAKPMPARPPNGKKSGGPADELVFVVAVDEAAVELVVKVFADEEVVPLLVVSPDETGLGPEPPELGSINIFIEAGYPAANRLALNELRAAEDG